MTPIQRLARAAGLALEWRDADGCDHVTGVHALGAVLTALGHSCDDTAAIGRSLERIAGEQRRCPAMLVGEVGQPTPLPITVARAELALPDGTAHELAIEDGRLAAIDEPGYYDLSLDGRELRLAIAPRHCPLPARGGLWGTAVQIPALRGKVQRMFGNLGDLDAAVQAFAARGADAVAINPLHAMFAGQGEQFSPYSPSSRRFLNAAMGDPALLGLSALASSDGNALIDWEAAMPRREAKLRAVFAGLDAATSKRIARDNAGEGEALVRHALFDALDGHFRKLGQRGWQSWPKALHDPAGAEARRFAIEHAGEVEFHLFTQWLAREGLAAVQRRADEAGMAVGLIADLAVGVDPRGSDCWASRGVMLQGLTIGAPPDPLGPLGQDWSLSSFSPQGLRDSGYEPWIAMLRSAFASAGGLRIDHAFGLARLWVIPEGELSAQGAYLGYPLEDLIRLVTLEAHLAGALVIAEDLGTSPFGFSQAIAERHMLGMRVLWFQRAADHGFIGARDHDRLAVAMTGTHDTPTVAGWWSGRDLDWASQLGRLPPGIDRDKAEEVRDWDRGLLWSTIDGGEPRPAPGDVAPVVDAALRHVAGTPSLLAIAPLEDLLAEPEQPNLPGTVAEHPNWRRRMSAPTAELLDDPVVTKRMVMLAAARGTS